VGGSGAGRSQGLFGSRPKLAMPQCAPPQNSVMSVAVEMLATGCGEPDLGVAMCGGRPNNPQCFVAHAGQNSSRERKLRGFKIGAAAKLPFGRAPSEAAHGAVYEALSKGS
jgi:hypothetical protein